MLNVLYRLPMLWGVAKGYEQLEIDRQLCFALYSASRAVVRAYGPLLDEAGLVDHEFDAFLDGYMPQAPLAPGTLASHYAPRTPLLLLERIEDFRPESGKKYGLLSYTGEPGRGYVNLHPWAAMECLSPGNGKLPEAALRLFHTLRKLDEAEAARNVRAMAQEARKRGIAVVHKPVKPAALRATISQLAGQRGQKRVEA